MTGLTRRSGSRRLRSGSARPTRSRQLLTGGEKADYVEGPFLTHALAGVAIGEPVVPQARRPGGSDPNFSGNADWRLLIGERQCHSSPTAT
jgi:hypothetical protein